MQTAALNSADQNTVLAGPATGSSAGPVGFRALVAADLPALIQNAIGALAAGIRAAASSAAVTGSLAINTGLTTVTNVVVTLRGAPTSQTLTATWSPLASTGWFSALVYAQATATNANPALSGTAANVDWIAFGT